MAVSLRRSRKFAGIKEKSQRLFFPDVAKQALLHLALSKIYDQKASYYHVTIEFQAWYALCQQCCEATCAFGAFRLELNPRVNWVLARVGAIISAEKLNNRGL